MGTEVLVAIVTGLASVMVAVLTSWFTAQRIVTQLEVKVNLLWETYIVDAVKKSRESGLVASRSPEAPTEKWNQEMPPKLRVEIEQTIRKVALYMNSPYDITIETVKNIGVPRLQRETNLDTSEIIGTIFVITERVLDHGHS